MDEIQPQMLHKCPKKSTKKKFKNLKINQNINFFKILKKYQKCDFYLKYQIGIKKKILKC